MYGSAQASGLNPKVGTGVGLAVVALPETGVGPQAVLSTLTTAFVLSGLICLSVICLVIALRLALGTR